MCAYMSLFRSSEHLVGRKAQLLQIIIIILEIFLAHTISCRSVNPSVVVGHSGSVVGSVPCIRKVAGSNPTLAAM